MKAMGAKIAIFSLANLSGRLYKKAKKAVFIRQTEPITKKWAPLSPSMLCSKKEEAPL